MAGRHPPPYSASQLQGDNHATQLSCGGSCRGLLQRAGGHRRGVDLAPQGAQTAYQKAFEAANPGIKIEILNKNTTAAVAYVRELPEGQRPDVMWASAPDAFEVLSRYKLL